MIAQTILDLNKLYAKKQENHKHCFNFCDCYIYDEKANQLETELVAAIGDICRAVIKDELDNTSPPA